MILRVYAAAITLAFILQLAAMKIMLNTYRQMDTANARMFVSLQLVANALMVKIEKDKSAKGK